MKDVTRAYRESAVRGASPVGLIVILYEEAARSIRRAQHGLQQNNVEQRTLALTHALDVIAHLQATLDFERGGDVARHLSRFYNLMRRRILEANVRPDNTTMDMLAQQFSSLAQVWRQVEHAVGGTREPVPVSPETGASSGADQFRLRGALAET